jgi:hypothetical protein
MSIFAPSYQIGFTALRAHFGIIAQLLLVVNNLLRFVAKTFDFGVKWFRMDYRVEYAQICPFGL